MRLIISSLTMATLTGIAGAASAQALCDCTSIAGSCTASASVQDSFIEISSDVAECARIDYLVDGMPFIALITNGAEQRSWDTSDGDPDVIVQSCQVCAVVSTPTANNEQNAIDNDGTPVRLLAVEPEYPAAAAAAGVEGQVEVRFSVSSSGRVTEAEVIAAEPAGVFEGAALAAVSRWRYSQSQPGETFALTETIEFSLADQLFSITPARPVPEDPVSARLPASNNCVREEAEFDFGPMIDVSLINACNEPLLVYSCAAGTDNLAARWRCSDPENTDRLLRTASGEPALPLFVDTPSGQRQFTGAGRLEITRAPNGEYWWLACRVDDTPCRQDGRAWVRSTHQQSISIDPRDQTRASLGRSY